MDIRRALRRGRDDADRDARTALEQAADPQSQGGFDDSVTRVVQGLLDVGIEGKGRFSSAQAIADAALRKSGGDPEKAVDTVVKQHLALGAASGFLTGLGGFVTMPVALPANVLGFYVLATRMSASIARLRGYDLSQPQIRTAVLLSLVGADAQDLLSRAGMLAPSGRVASMAAQRLPGPALMVLNKAIGFRLLSTAGRSTLTRFGRSVPLVGGALGAGLDGWLLKQLATHAREEFPVTEPAGTPAAVDPAGPTGEHPATPGS